MYILHTNIFLIITSTSPIVCLYIWFRRPWPYRKFNCFNKVNFMFHLRNSLLFQGHKDIFDIMMLSTLLSHNFKVLLYKIKPLINLEFILYVGYVGIFFFSFNHQDS